MNNIELRTLIIIAMCALIGGLWIWYFNHFPMMVYFERGLYFTFNTIVTFVIGYHGIDIYKNSK